MGKEKKSLRDIAAENVKTENTGWVTAEGETRTVSSTGGEKGTKAQAFNLIPWGSVAQIAEQFNFGANKYSDHNWRKGYEWSKSYAALMRHLTAWWEGEDIDDESGMTHLAAAGFHILVLLTFEREARYAQHDDRYKAPEEPRTFATGGLVTGSLPTILAANLDTYGPYYTSEQVQQLRAMSLIQGKRFVKPGVDGSFEQSLPEDATGYVQ